MNWNVSYMGKSLLKKAPENPAKNVVTIKKSDLLKKGSFIITFNKIDTSSNITLMADDENRSGLMSWENITRSVTISNANFKHLLANRKTIQFFYSAIPKDPAKAMLVRMRPIHVCTVMVE